MPNLFSDYTPLVNIPQFIKCAQCGREFAHRHSDREGPDGKIYCHNCLCQLFQECTNCGRFFSCRDGIESENESFYCEHCYHERYVQCHACCREVEYNHGHYNRGPDTYIYCDSCFERRFFVCDNCGRTFCRADHHAAPNGDEYCDICFTEICTNCNGCGNPIFHDDAQISDGRPYCQDCHHPSHEWAMGDFNVPNPSYERIGSIRRYGVELETCYCPNYHTLNGQIIWACKHDCSIEGMEFVSPILYGDEGLDEIANFCQLAEEKEFEVNRACGYHVHFDVSMESEKALKSIAYAYCKTYQLWCCFVPNHRSASRYCGAPDYDCTMVVFEDFDYFVGKRDRFEYVNWRAYLVHGSVEIRLYQGTLNTEEICNWIRLHIRFIDKVKTMTIAEIDAALPTIRTVSEIYSQFNTVANFVGNELASYWATKAQELSKPVKQMDSVSTRARPRRVVYS